MRILILCADASTNSVVRIQPIAKVLQRNHDVLVGGFRSQETLFEPYSDELDYRTERTRPLPSFLTQVHRMVSSASADLVYAFKPRSTSMWTGLAVRRRLGVPLVLDIEDWELGWYLDQPWVNRLKHLRHVSSPNGFAWTALNEKLIERCDHRFVVSSFLQRRFGGTLLRHGPYTVAFSPDRLTRDDALAELGLPAARYILFAGSVMRNKGVEDLLLCVERLALRDVRVLLVGSSRHDPAYHQQLVSRFGHLLAVVGPRPHREMPVFLAASSLIVLAQRTARETIAQVPGKAFEAMAMARPVIATAVSDLPEILDGAGVVIPPGDHEALKSAVITLLHDEALASSMGTAARARCVEQFGWDAMERILERDLERLRIGWQDEPAR